MLFESTLHVQTSRFFAHNTCRLIIFIQPVRIYLTLLGPQEEIMYCREYHNQNKSADVLFLRYVFEQEQILSHSYASTKVYIDGDFCLIPDHTTFFKQRHDFARLLLDADVLEEELYYYPFPESDIAGLFIPPPRWISLLNEYLSSYELSSSSDLLFRLGNLLHNSLKPLLLIQLLDTHINILGFKRQNLEFIQRYPFLSALDIVYFIQLSLSILNKKGETDIWVVGEVDQNSSLWEELLRHFPKIKFPPSLEHRNILGIDSNNWWKYTYLT